MNAAKKNFQILFSKGNWFLRSSLFFLLACMAAGCGGLGASRIKGERTDYNIAIQRSNDQQLLLNLVRLKYRDTPFFLEVSSVASQFILRGDFSANADLPDGSPNAFGLGAGVGVEERPTVTYAPLQGEQFIQRFLSHIPMETVFLLYRSGWSIERVFRLCLQRLSDLKNAPSASGPTPTHPPIYKEFANASRLFRNLQLQDALDVSLGKYENLSTLAIKVKKDAGTRKELRELNSLLGFSPENDHFFLAAGLENRDGHVRVETRSLLGVMYYLSHEVEIPEEDVAQGKTTITRLPNGEPFDWSEVTGDLLHIRSLPHTSGQASVEVAYRNNRFFIDDSDLTSKSTFSLLGQIFYLQAGRVESVSPVLTLPVGK